ncbi:thiamine pyrophosphate-dependent enzyme [bacterium]|nr:thiamine pyrophosphate-dependent enzyme [bacterium]
MNKLHNDLANCIRFLSIDAVQKANSGHPGMPMGMADVATVLFKSFLRFNPKNPNWLNRDRFVLSAGHGSMLLYSLLYLTGYKSISLKSIKNFRQLNSICAGHPEYHPRTGIETTTGPLGQGIANAVGFAVAEEILKKKLGKEIINHKTYVLAGDGCLMEGISHEAMSLAGHLKLKNLVMLFDNNSISIDGPTNLAVSDNFKKRFESYGWEYILIDGHNEKEIYKALKRVQNAKKPTVISCKTKIGYGSPNKSGKSSSHGSPLGLDEIKLVRNALNWNYKPFEIPNKILNEWKKIGKRGEKLDNAWSKIYKKKKVKKTKTKTVVSLDQKKEKIENETPEAVPLPDKTVKKIETKKENKQNPDKLDKEVKQVSEFEKKELVDLDNIAKLIDKAKEDTAELLKKNNDITQDQDKNIVTSGLTLSEEDALKAQIFGCWSIPLGLPYNEDLLVRIKLMLEPDGSVAKTEILDHARMNKPGQGFYKVLAESALRAVKLCQPLRVPTTGYERWKELQLNFDAREMLEG